MKLPTLYSIESEPIVASVIFWERPSGSHEWTSRRAGFVSVNILQSVAVAYVEVGGMPDFVGQGRRGDIETLVDLVRGRRGVPRLFTGGGEWR